MVLGATAQLGQILIFREVLAVCHGTEILFGIVLAGHLGWTAVGSAAATLATRRLASARRAADVFVALAAAAGLLLCGEILLARVLAGWGAAPGEMLSVARSAALALLVTGPLGLAGGAMFVLALRSRAPGGFSGVYQAESWGAVLGALGFTFGIVHVAGPVRTALLAGVAFGLAALWLMRPRPKAVGFFAMACVAVSAAGACMPIEPAAEQMRWRNLLGGYELLEARDTPYGHAAALRRTGTRQVAVFHGGSLVASLEPGADAAGDTRQLADLCGALHPAPRRVLLVGGALGTLPEQFLRHGATRVDAVEPDPALFALAQRHAGPPPADGRVRRIAADGRRFVTRAQPGSYDLAVISAGEPDNAVANRYYTVEFFRHAARALDDRGVLVVLLPTYGAAPEYLGRRLVRKAATVWRAMGEAFGAPGRAAPVGGILLAAAKGGAEISLDPRALGRRLAERPAARPTIPVKIGERIEHVPVEAEDYFAGLYGGVLAMRQSLDGPTVSSGRRGQRYVQDLERALSAADVRANRDGHPVAVAESLAFGAEVAGADLKAQDPHAGVSLSDVLGTWGPWSMAACVGAALLAAACPGAPGAAGFLARGRRGPRAGLLLCAFATGLFGMAMVVSLLWAYQNVRGCAYAEIGGLTASFMVGLALGALCTRRTCRRGRAVLAGLVAGMIAVSAAAGATVAALGRAGDSLFAAGALWGLVLLAGFLDGATFPPLVALGSRGHSDRPGSSAGGFGGWVYAADLAGAGVGALLVGPVWIPLLGVTASGLGVAGILAAALLGLAARARA